MENEELRSFLSKIVSPENEKNWYNPELFEKNTRKLLPKELEIIAPPPEEEINYNCFIFVFGLNNDERFLGEASWVFRSDFVKLLLKHNLLKEAPKVQNGSIVLYKNKEGIITHSGIIEDVGTVISKWSWGPIIRHKTLDVPTDYGDTVTFYQKPNISEVKNIVDLAETYSRENRY